MQHVNLLLGFHSASCNEEGIRDLRWHPVHRNPAFQKSDI